MDRLDKLKIDENNFLLFKKGGKNYADEVSLYTKNSEGYFRSYESKTGRIEENGNTEQRIQLFIDMLNSFKLLYCGGDKNE